MTSSARPVVVRERTRAQEAPPPRQDSSLPWGTPPELITERFGNVHTLERERRRTWPR